MTSDSIVQKILRDHKNITTCIEQYKKNSSNPAEQEKWKHQMIFEFAQHATSEELTVYPVMERMLEGGLKMRDHDLQQHTILKQLLVIIDNKMLGQKEEEKTVDEILHHFNQHKTDEEEIQLPLLEKCLDKNELEKLGKAFDAAKVTCPTHPHPHAPDKPESGEAFIGMMSAPWDRIRDVFRNFPDKQELKKMMVESV